MSVRPHVDIFSVLSFFAGCGGIASAISIPESMHTLKVATAVFSVFCLFCAQALRVFFNQTPTQVAMVPDSTSHQEVAVDVKPSGELQSPKGP